MSKPTDVRIGEVRTTFVKVPFRMPLKFGGRVQTETELIDVQVDAVTAGGASATGFGSMPVGHVWAWPGPHTAPEQASACMKRLAGRLAGTLPRDRTLHPLDHMIRHTETYAATAAQVAGELGIAETVPPLAVLVAASALDAAVHDAFGRANGISSYDGLSAEFVADDLSHYLTPQFAGEFLDRYTLRTPKPRMPLYHLVGALDPLTEADVSERPGDGLPVTLPEWIVADGLTHLKVKLGGDDLEWDVRRVREIDRVCEQVQAGRGVSEWFYSLDFNERCDDAGYVLEFLARVEESSPRAVGRVQYIEQPTHRDLSRHPGNRMHAVARRKPVVIDESLTDLESLLLARELGYTGVALKACKGHTESLLLGAAAQKLGMFLCVQDLTCPGASFLHSAGLAARIPTVAAVEGNGRQYCPAGNAGWEGKFPGMFAVTDGMLRTAELTRDGLGHTAV